jgi:hypothetical protein
MVRSSANNLLSNKMSESVGGAEACTTAMDRSADLGSSSYDDESLNTSLELV